MLRKALLVGLNDYPNPENHLKGCINDVLQTSRVLQDAYGFDDARQIRMLTDRRATTAAIAHRLRWLVDGARPGDLLVFHYSGHGSQVRDREGDELEDGLDEIICPYDLDWDDPFTDDDLYEIVKDVPAGVNLTIILDCCHAGTGLRAAVSPHAPIRPKCIVPPADILHRVNPTIEDCGASRRLTMGRARRDLEVRAFATRAAERGAILLAACAADQVSADAWIDGDFHGAFTHFLWKSAADWGYRMSYADLMRRTRQLLQIAEYEQLPQLEGPGSLLTQPAFAPFALEAV